MYEISIYTNIYEPYEKHFNIDNLSEYDHKFYKIYILIPVLCFKKYLYFKYLC